MRRRDFLHLSGVPLVLSALAVSRAGAQSAAPGLVVETTAGRLRGRAADGLLTFKGIRYGASTAGVNRFQPPVKPQPWTGIVDAVEYGPRAWQPFRAMIPEIGDALTGSGPMDEDCLRLNVWTPAIDRSRRPVMVWFHGGGQRTGSGNSIFYDGSELARKHDVVVVTLTHRLNALGYLWLAGLPGASERFARTANLPLADLVLALEWVRDNVAQFGGNPANVTIFGQSGGGGKVAMLSAFPAAKGLFHRAIIMSTLADTAVTGLAPARAVEAAELLLGASRRQRVGRGEASADAGRADRCGIDRWRPRRRTRRSDRDGRHLAALRAGGRRAYAARASVRACAVGTLGDDSDVGRVERMRRDSIRQPRRSGTGRENRPMCPSFAPRSSESFR